MIALVHKHNPFKIAGTDKFHPQIAEMLDAWHKEDPPRMKKLLVEADVLEYLANTGQDPHASVLDQTIGDLKMMTFYFLLRIGEYTNKAKRSSTKQTVRFKFEDVTFFRKNSNGQL